MFIFVSLETFSNISGSVSSRNSITVLCGLNWFWMTGVVNDRRINFLPPTPAPLHRIRSSTARRNFYQSSPRPKVNRHQLLFILNISKLIISLFWRRMYKPSFSSKWNRMFHYKSVWRPFPFDWFGAVQVSKFTKFRVTKNWNSFKNFPPLNFI